MAMIWIECDCCNRTLTKNEHYVTCRLRNFGVRGNVPTTVHLCEQCYQLLRKAGEVVKHDV